MSFTYGINNGTIKENGQKKVMNNAFHDAFSSWVITLLRCTAVAV